MKTRRSWVLAVLVAGSQAAPPPPASQGPKIPDVREDVGLVIVMRLGMGLPMTRGAVPIYVDDQEVFAVKDRRYTFFWVTPGPHRFKAQWSALQKPWFEGHRFDTSTLDLEVEAGKAYFMNYRIEQEAELPSPVAPLIAPFSKSSVLSTGLVLLTHELGRLDLSYCSFQENRWR